MSNTGTYIIADDDRKVMQFEGVKMFGHKCNLLAFFTDEQSALNVLFEVEQANPDLKKHGVFRVEPMMTMTEVVR